MNWIRFIGDWIYGIWITFTTHSNSEEQDEYPEDAKDNCS